MASSVLRWGSLTDYLLPSSHTLPLTLVKPARLTGSSIRSIRAYLTAVDIIKESWTQASTYCRNQKAEYTELLGRKLPRGWKILITGMHQTCSKHACIPRWQCTYLRNYDYFSNFNTYFYTYFSTAQTFLQGLLRGFTYYNYFYTFFEAVRMFFGLWLLHKE